MVHRYLKAAITAGAVGLAMLPASASAAAQHCSTGDAATAAEAIHGSGTEVVRTEEVAGLQTALVLEPYIAPGTRHRLVLSAGQWCSAETALNKAWLASGRSVGDGRGIAAAYARLAAAPYFDDTTTTSHTTVAGVHTITTHARTNGITAAWTIKTDASGVRFAKWASTGFGVKPFVAEIEGLTAYGDAHETYTRAAGGLLDAKRGLPTRADLAIEAPSATMHYDTPDGFRIFMAAGDSRQMADSGTDSGVYEVDKAQLRAVRRMVAENYAEFHKWGFRANWDPPRTRAVLVNSPAQIPAAAKTGYVYMNDGVTAYCLACVFIATDFQIHMFQEVDKALAALGYSYPAGRDYDVYSDIIGHEMFHNWQNNYYRPGTGRSVPGSYSEGTARFQETLHDYSDASHQSESLVYANDANGCNGALASPPDNGLASGVFQTQSYSACQFWIPWYATMGREAFVKLVTDGMASAATPREEGPALNNAGKVLEGITIATGRSYTESAAVFAAAYISGKNMTYGSFIEGDLAPRDWGQFLERWTPTVLDVGATASRTLQNGGLMGHEVTGAFRPSVEGADTDLVVIRSSAGGTQIDHPAKGSLVAGPAAGERVYLLAVKRTQGATPVTLTAGQP